MMMDPHRYLQGKSDVKLHLQAGEWNKGTQDLTDRHPSGSRKELKSLELEWYAFVTLKQN